MWRSISKILPFNVDRLGLAQINEITVICSKWDENICALFGEDYKCKAKPMSLKDKILVVDCLNSVWSSEFQLKQSQIIAQLNECLKKEAVEKIRFIS